MLAKAKQKLEDGEAELAREAKQLKDKATQMAEEAKQAAAAKLKGLRSQ